MVTKYELPATGEPTVNEIEIKRSRFITWIARAESEEEARDIVARARQEFPDARHHCSAFIVHIDGAVPVERSSDDGEPAGTAGKPILDVLRGSGMESVVAVVVRYFGGVKLGAGGLVHAYSESVSQAVEAAPRAEKTLRELVAVDLPHADAGRIEAELRTHGIDVVDVAYGTQARYIFAITPGGRKEFDALLATSTQGSAAAREAGTMWVERPR